MCLIHFMPLVSFYIPWKHKKPRGCLIFSRGIEIGLWHEVDEAHHFLTLTLKAPTPQNGQIHSINSSAAADELFECVWPFCRVGASKVKCEYRSFSRTTITNESKPDISPKYVTVIWSWSPAKYWPLIARYLLATKTIQD